MDNQEPPTDVIPEAAESQLSHETSIDKTQFPFGPIASFGLSVLLFVLSQFAAVIAIGLYLNITSHGQGTSVWIEKSVYGQFWLTFVAELVVIGGIFLLLRTKQRTLQAIALTKVKFRDVGYALAGFAVYFPVLLISTQLISQLIPSINLNQKQDIGFSTATTGMPLVAVFISLVILPPLAEEILFRGFLYSGLKTKIKPLFAAVLVSVVFAMAHLPTGNGQPLLWAAGIDTFLLSLVLVYLREKTGSLWASIFLHAIKNGIAFLSLFVLKV